QETPVEAPVVFHLDDVLLVNAQKQPLTFGKDTPITAFDQLLAIRSPGPAAPDVLGMPHVSMPLLDRNYLAAEVYVVEEGEGERALLRLVDHDGKLHDLRDERIRGTPGKTPALGARAAVENDHPHVEPSAAGRKGGHELHLIDTQIDDFSY